MNRTIGGIPVLYWLAGLGAVIGGALWLKKKQAAGTSTATAKTPPFTQAQEVQDFQIFSSLTSAQQASDLSMVSELASLFGGGGSSATGSTSGGGGGSGAASGSSGGGGTSAVPSPPSTGTTAPATVPASSASVLPEISSTQAYPSNYIFANPSSLNVGSPSVQPASAGGTSYNPPAPALPAGETSGEYYSIPGDPY